MNWKERVEAEVLQVLSATREFAVNNDCPVTDSEGWVEPMVENAARHMAEWAKNELQLEAIEFAEWILKEEWYAEDGKWYDAPFTGSGKKVTTAELYTLFQNNKTQSK